jgi:hypothetical protein
MRALLVAMLAALAVTAAVVVFAIRGHNGPQGPDAAEGFGYIHGIAVDPGSGALHVATHVGLFRVDDTGTAVRVSTEAPDLMGFTVVGPGHFLASGHPDLYDDGPANLGLIESTDGGVTWRTMSLPGSADFHGLRAAHGAVYGYNSTDGAFMVSTDRRTWQIIAGSPGLAVLAWDQADQTWGVARDGTVWRSTDGGSTWQRIGAVDGRPQALATHGADVFVALDGDRIVASGDGGGTWRTRYAPN